MNVSCLKNVLLIVGCFVLLSFAECAKNKKSQDVVLTPRIVGGHIATKRYPFVASIMADNIFGRYHSCGGSIINERTVITAAHCLAHATASNLKIHVGENGRQVNNGDVYEVLAIHYHPQWNMATQDYDVGLVRIARNFNYGPTVQPIKLASTKDKLKDGSLATVFGWGYTNQYGPNPSDELRIAQVPIVKQSTCNRQMGGLVTRRMICAGFRSGGVDACQMDSGGPLVADNKLIGIVSWGVGCAQPNRPGIYARITELLPWIDNTLFKEYNEIL